MNKEKVYEIGQAYKDLTSKRPMNLRTHLDSFFCIKANSMLKNIITRNCSLAVFILPLNLKMAHLNQDLKYLEK